MSWLYDLVFGKPNSIKRDIKRGTPEEKRTRRQLWIISSFGHARRKAVSREGITKWKTTSPQTSTLAIDLKQRSSNGRTKNGRSPEGGQTTSASNVKTRHGHHP